MKSMNENMRQVEERMSKLKLDRDGWRDKAYKLTSAVQNIQSTVLQVKESQAPIGKVDN